MTNLHKVKEAAGRLLKFVELLETTQTDWMTLLRGPQQDDFCLVVKAAASAMPVMEGLAAAGQAFSDAMRQVDSSSWPEDDHVAIWDAWSLIAPALSAYREAVGEQPQGGTT